MVVNLMGVEGGAHTDAGRVRVGAKWRRGGPAPGCLFWTGVLACRGPLQLRETPRHSAASRAAAPAPAPTADRRRTSHERHKQHRVAGPTYSRPGTPRAPVHEDGSRAHLTCTCVSMTDARAGSFLPLVLATVAPCAWHDGLRQPSHLLNDGAPRLLAAAAALADAPASAASALVHVAMARGGAHAPRAQLPRERQHSRNGCERIAGRPPSSAAEPEGRAPPTAGGAARPPRICRPDSYSASSTSAAPTRRTQSMGCARKGSHDAAHTTHTRRVRAVVALTCSGPYLLSYK